MPSRNVTCPTGLRGVVRVLRGAEANILADAAAARRLQTFDKILEACWESTDDHGRLGEKYVKDGKITWSKVLLGDRFFALLQIRIATYGTEYAFKHKCESCGDNFEWEIDLEKDLRIQPYSDAALDSYISGEPLTDKLPDGKIFSFRIANGETEKEAARRVRKKRDEAVTVSISERIVEIEGIGSDKTSIRAYLEELELPDLYEISDTIDKHEGGVVTDLEIECTECGAENLVRLPFVGDFWISRDKRRKRAAGEA